MLLAVGPARAQAPTGTLAGVVTDPAGTPVAGARLRLNERVDEHRVRRRIVLAGDEEMCAVAFVGSGRP